MDRELTFRDAQATDAADLAEIGRETFVETFGDLYPAGDLRKYLSDTYSVDKMASDLDDPQVEIRAACSGRRMVAYCKIGPCKLPFDVGLEAALELHRLYVYQARQGVGVGRILLAWAIERARQRGAKNLFLSVGKSNERAVALYESRGFEKVGAHKVKVGEISDYEFIMQLHIG